MMFAKQMPAKHNTPNKLTIKVFSEKQLIKGLPAHALNLCLME
jgi:hypothetical protein